MQPIGAGRGLCVGLIVSIGTFGSCVQSAQASGGTVYAWGLNDYGQLGDGTTVPEDSPIPVPGLSSGVTAVAVGEKFSLAIQNGALLAWGNNASGELGDNSTTNHITPEPVNGMSSGVTAIGAGDYHGLAIQNGALYAWGANNYGQIGDGSTKERNTPVLVSGMSSGVTAVTGDTSSSLAIQNGAAFAWGQNDVGELGNGTTDNGSNPVPVPVTGMSSGVTAITGDGGHNLAIRNGGAFAWGSNARGDLGDGSTDDSYTPVAVLGMSNGVTAIAVGERHSLALRDGIVYTWGNNNSGQLGIGSTDDFNHPTPTALGLTDIIALAAGGASSFALSGDGSLWVWGSNSNGQLGLGDDIDRSIPTQLLPPAGYDFSLIENHVRGGDHALAVLVSVPEPSSFLLFIPLAMLAFQRQVIDFGTRK